MAYISFQPTDYYNTKLYTGTGSSNAQTGVGFQPDLVWIKDRDDTENHVLTDSARGATKTIYSNLTDAEATIAEGLKSFDSDGFTVGTSYLFNDSGEDFVSWNWKAGTTTGLSGGTITPSSYSISTTAGQSIIAYTGTGSAATVPHGLGVVPKVVIVKKLSAVEDWTMLNMNLSGEAEKYLVLNTTQAVADSTTTFNDTDPTTTVFSVGTAGSTNGSAATYVAYCFTDVKGYSKMGSYRGNAAADGPFVYTGFRPAFVMIKNSESVQAWNTFDDKRSTSTKNTTDFLLQPNDLGAETTGVDGIKTIDLLATGFKVRGLNNEINKNTDTLIYMAFAEFPFVSSNSKPGTAR